MEKHEPQLSSFFDSIYHATHPATKSNKSLDKLDRRLAFECYLVCSNRNSKITAFKEAISYFVDLMGASTEAIDALSYAGITISRRHLDRQKAIIADEHPNRVASYLQINKNNTMVLNIDDYHNIHAKRMPNTCSTSTVAHMTTLVLNNINSIPIPRTATNGTSIHNPRLIDSCL